MLSQMAPKTTKEKEDIESGMQAASVYFPALLNFTDAEKKDITNRTSVLQSLVSARLANEVTDSLHRIAGNYALCVAATELVITLPFML